ncbi:MAG TPA: TRAP transporter large permease [Alphaproteobacteria bacterium]|nr:TRAP transporter large permease [Alphaproteobacteria bacterium]
MEWYWTIALLFGAIIALMSAGLPVGVAFLGVNIAAATAFMGGSGGLFERLALGVTQLLSNGMASITIFAIIPVPMFLLMGEFFFHFGLADRMFNAVDRLTGRLPARLSYVTVAGGTAFATLSGSSMGATALMGTLMVPEMTKRGYKSHMSIGPILGTGGLAMIIPPSALAVLLGTLAQLDIGKLLIAGIVPGLVLAVMYVVLIYIRTRIDPGAAPAYDVPIISRTAKLRLIVTDIVPMMGVVVLVILMIMTGWATPSESAAFGCFFVLLLAFAYRSFKWRAFWKAAEGAARVTVIAFLIIFGSATFSQILAFSGASAGLIAWATGFPVSELTMLLIMFGVLLVLGCFMDQLSMMLLTVPVFFPLVKTELSFGLPEEVRLIWFGVIMLLALEISLTTPPFGLLLFVMKGVSPPGTSMAEIYRAGLPFMGCAVLLVVLLIIFPKIASWLPFLGTVPGG